MKRITACLCVLMLMLTVFPGARAEQPDDALVTRYLEQQAAEQKDPWVAAIFAAGAQNISWEGDTAAFFLRSFDPALKALGSYPKAEDKDAWRQKAFENMQAYSLEARLTFEAGEATKKSGAALVTLVKKTAGSAKGALGNKDWTQAMTDMLFPSPTAQRNPDAAALQTVSDGFATFIRERADLFPCEDPSEWAPAFYVQRAWKFSLKQGPNAVRLTWDGMDPAGFLSKAYDSLIGMLAAKPGAERDPESSLPGLWKNTLAETALKTKKGRLVSQSAEFALDDLIAGKLPEGYTAYFAKYTPGEYYDRVVEGYRKMPETAALEIPKSGKITMAKKGRGIFVKVAKDGRNTYVQLRDADTGVVQADAFLRPGDSVNLKIPEGVYTVHYASGSTWYGTEETFGETGDYTASDEFTVAKKKWKLTANEEQPGITLHAITAADMKPAEDKSVHVEGSLMPTTPVNSSYAANNPVLEGVSSTTGLPASGEKYTPIVMVLDNAEDAYPHWGVAQADIIFQVPNAGSGATKLLALFADHYPTEAGPVRSGRSSMLPAPLSFDAAFAFAGPPAVTGGEVDLLAKLTEFGMTRTHRVYNLLNSNGFGQRWQGIKGGHNLSCLISAIHDNLVQQAVEFEERPFLFTDEERTEGAAANIVRVLHRGEDPNGASNSASRAVFKYDPALKGYIRRNSSGIYSDRLTGEIIPFANVIVIRAGMSYDKNYIYMTHHMAGSGAAEIFQNGRYVRGAWVRENENSRLVLVDADGSELKLQRGKTFIVITNEVTNVIYTE